VIANASKFGSFLIGQWYETVPDPASQTLKSESRRCHSSLVIKRKGRKRVAVRSLPHSSHTAITVSSQFGGKPEPQKLGYLTLGAVGSLMGRKYESPSKIAPSMRRAVPIILTLVCLRKASHDHSSRVLRK